MQDFDTKMEGIQNQIKALFIDSPGENTIDLNKDHFVKERIQCLCKSCTASYCHFKPMPLGGVGGTSIREALFPLLFKQTDFSK